MVGAERGWTRAWEAAMWSKVMNWWSTVEGELAWSLMKSELPEHAYLAQAADAADLERQLRQLEQHTCEAALVRLKAMAWARA